MFPHGYESTTVGPMKLEKWALIAEIAGGVAIVASLIILIVEVRDAGNAIREQTIAAQRNYDSEIRGRFMENRGGLADLILAEYGDAPITETERVRVYMYYADALDSFAWQYRQVTLGRLSEADLATGLWGTLLLAEISREAFEFSKDRYDPDFVQYIEENFITSR
jgi:hypothetical protein